MYTIGSHLGMIADEGRTSAFRRALAETVEPGCRVADIGTGTGIFAIMACKLGAGRVYAIEPDLVVEVARQAAADNGVADQIEFIPFSSTEVDLPEPVDLVVADLGGVLPYFKQAVPALIDARERFLADDGLMIPARDTMRAVLVQTHKPFPYDLEALTDPGLGVDMTAGMKYATNAWIRGKPGDAAVLTEPQTWGMLDYMRVSSPAARGNFSAPVIRMGIANAICVWFDRELTADTGFSNAPDQPELIYGQALFPLERPVKVHAGDGVAVRFEAQLAGEDYAWRWETNITPSDGGAPSVAFQQSTVRSVPASISRLRRREASYRPRVGTDGAIDDFVLSRMDGTATLSEIAGQLMNRFPERFADEKSALDGVARLSERYSV